jgi:hypothetical protein
MRRLLGMVLFVSVASCNSDFGPSGRYEKWLKDGPKSYAMIISRTCTDCPAEMMGPVHVSVLERSGVVRTYVSSGERVPRGLELFFPTVNELFYMIDVMKVDKRYKLHVEYDPQLEIPIAIDIDSFANGVDAKVAIRVTEFHAQ